MNTLIKILLIIFLSIPSILYNNNDNNNNNKPQIEKWTTSSFVENNNQDITAGLNFFKKRYYDPRVNFWISTDPYLSNGKYFPKPQDFDTDHNYLWRSLHDESGNLPGLGGVFNPINLNVYGYAGQNPVKYVDPDGNYISEAANRSIQESRNISGKIRDKFPDNKIMNFVADMIDGMATDIMITPGAIGGGVFKGIAFASEKHLIKHFAKHGSEMGLKSMGEYLQAAKSLFSKSGTNILKHTSKEGTSFVYDAAKNEFGVLSKSGKIETFFKPERGIEYFKEQVKKYK